LKNVLDTNVLVSGMLKPYSVPGEILRRVISGNLTLCIDARIFAEYREVLHRPKFKLDKEKVSIVLDYIKDSSEWGLAVVLQQRLNDRDGEAFLEIALGSKVKYLVTGNKKDFPVKKEYKISIVSPKEFTELIL
jgi:putative PIN family toxin of toxin-antitoxin system